MRRNVPHENVLNKKKKRVSGEHSAAGRQAGEMDCLILRSPYIYILLFYCYHYLIPYYILYILYYYLLFYFFFYFFMYLHLFFSLVCALERAKKEEKNE